MNNIISRVKNVLAKDMNCNPGDFDMKENITVISKKVDGRRDFPYHENRFNLITTGNNIVVSCDETKIKWVEENIMKLERDDVFSSDGIKMINSFLSENDLYTFGPDMRMVYCTANLKEISLNPVYEYKMFYDEEIYELYNFSGFDNALRYNTTGVRPDKFAAVCYIDGKIAGMAGCSADNDEMYQAGVDVKEEYRNRGIARQLVSMVTNEIVKADKIPYYSTHMANIFSKNISESTGYKTLWVEIASRPK